MGKGAIVRVWGKADKYDLTFHKGADGGWNTAVPPDLTDGQYATEIHALDEQGMIALWTGILYMHNGRACLHLKEDEYTFWFLPQTELVPKYESEDGKYVIEVKGVCCVDQL